MRANALVVMFLAVVCGLVPATGAAQERQGFWIGFGGGYGSAGVSCDDCDDGREGSGAGYLRLGATLNERVLLGGEFNIWSKSARSDVEGEDFEATFNLYNFVGSVTFYPNPSKGFFVRGGAGAAIADVDIESDGSTLTVEIGTGFGVVGGAGYDFRVGRNISVTPAVDFWYGNAGDLRFAGQTFLSNFKYNVVAVTVGITFH